MSRNLGYVLGVLAVAAVVFGVYVVTEEQRSAREPSGPRLLFPDLRAVINEVMQIRGINADGPYTLKRESGAWRLVERGDFPADRWKVNQMLLGMLDLTLIEKTEDGFGPQAPATHHVALQDRQGKTLAGAIVREVPNPPLDSGKREVLVRTPSEPQVWLGTTSMPRIVSMVDWLDQELLRIDDRRIAELSVQHADGQRVRVVRSPGDTIGFVLDEAAGQRGADKEHPIGLAVTTVSDLAFDNVYAADDLPLATDATVAIKVLTYDGMQIEIRTTRVDKVWRMRLRAAALIRAPVPPAPSSDAFQDSPVLQLKSSAVRAQIETLNRRWRGYVFEVDAQRLALSAPPLKDMLEPPSSPAPGQPAAGAARD